ncbi:hypothetical protein [Falsiruegeria mediterranea]|uniref:Uncharacterized protein n=1 Tax=Falsiruegeria mediterranea M17 TaxID=1200281 RepID=A0A2R8C722_9RHOB|nr:hypothetical protein [Falsiruegeria mediterranea]SPJ28244.1 hypothetical protein TRM7615_01741 [Falsiruegeria mediterranea M17]
MDERIDKKNLTLEEALERIQTAPPLRKVKAFLDQTDLSADLKALLYDVAKITVKVGEVIVAVGRRVLQIAMTLVHKFPHSTLGLIVATILSTILSVITAGAGPTVLGIVVAFQKLMYLLGIGAGVVEDIRQNAMKEAMDRVAVEFGVLGPTIQE